MHITFVKSLTNISYDDWQPVALDVHRGKAARIMGTDLHRTLMLILPCGHTATLDGWDVTNIDTDSPSATPSVFCMVMDNKPCWHGFLTNGELIEV